MAGEGGLVRKMLYTRPSQMFPHKRKKLARHQKPPHYEGLFKLRRVDGVGYPYLRGELPKRSIIKWQFFCAPDFNKEQYGKSEFPVLLTKTVEGVGKAGDVLQVKRGFYRYFLLENEAARPLTKFSDIPQEILDQLAVRHPPINNPETDRETYNNAVLLLSEGINITFDAMAKWVITPFHLAKMVSARTGFDLQPHHFKMDRHEIRKPGVYTVHFKHENGMELDVPIHVAIATS